jgi:hypothetical protein
MHIKKECRLRLPGSISIDYPSGYRGTKSDPTEEAFFVSTEPRWLTMDEIDLAAKRLIEMNKAFPSRMQALVYTGAIQIDPKDPLRQATHEQLNAIEKANGLPCSCNSPAGGHRSVLERVLIIREQGCFANAATYLTSN